MYVYCGRDYEWYVGEGVDPRCEPADSPRLPQSSNRRRLEPARVVVSFPEQRRKRAHSNGATSGNSVSLAEAQALAFKPHKDADVSYQQDRSGYLVRSLAIPSLAFEGGVP